MLNKRIEITIPEDVQNNWQEIVDILTQVCNVPVGLIMRLDESDIEVFVSNRSQDNPYRLGDKEHFQGSGLYCETVINSRGKLLIPDALADENWKNNPDIRLNMISYLGFPVFLPTKKPFGTICVLDNKRNEYSPVVEQLMLKFKDMIESHLELIFLNQALVDENKQLTDYLMELQALRGIVPICSSCKSIRDKEDNWHPVEHYLIRHPEAELSHGICPECVIKLYPEYVKGSR
ncbi:GAF domain-containing protein [Desulfobulbus alkaliphilus]|uniref:GAF domain-containing protein n=1 Tax=Desulfobulbus alkaliphilus TaxID=869814 RepID=UPI0019642138|nr:GAF domain-containing protein [Desulfobulbus alkaliphilus]MBM9536088.1 GAF domain-containing protein [Desulfobulbus alkaliphilus]